MSALPLDLFDDIPVFLAVVSADGVRGAARELGLGASAVSKALTRLEARLGVRLLDRGGRGVTLTDEGRAIHDALRAAADRALSARELALEAQRRPRGTLRVSTSPVLAPVLAGACGRLRERHPELVLHLSVSDRVVRLGEGELDVAIRLGDDAPRGAVRRRLASTRFVTVAAPSYLARRGTPERPSELVSHEAVRFVPPSGVPQTWGLGDDAMAVGALADEGSAVVRLAEHGVGLARVLSFMARGALAEGRLVEVLREHAGVGPGVHAVGTAARMRTLRARAFVELAREALADLDA